jgi:hypothetical protein
VVTKISQKQAPNNQTSKLEASFTKVKDRFGGFGGRSPKKAFPLNNVEIGLKPSWGLPALNCSSGLRGSLNLS